MICVDCGLPPMADEHRTVEQCATGAVGRECEEPDFHHPMTLDPALHCFREDSPTNACRDCGEPPEAHTGCDCEDES